MSAFKQVSCQALIVSPFVSVGKEAAETNEPAFLHQVVCLSCVFFRLSFSLAYRPSSSGLIGATLFRPGLCPAACVLRRDLLLPFRCVRSVPLRSFRCVRSVRSVPCVPLIWLRSVPFGSVRSIALAPFRSCRAASCILHFVLRPAWFHSYCS